MKRLDQRSEPIGDVGGNPKRALRALLAAGLPGFSPRGFWAAVRLNIFVVALMAIWTTLNTVLLPGRVAGMVDLDERASALGLAGLIGIGVATTVQPVIGRISDRSRWRDRRRPFIVGGSAVAIACFALFAWAPGFIWLVVAYLLLQIALNVAQAAFQALIPDLVAPDALGLAAGVKSVLSVAGVALGLLGTALLLRAGYGDGAGIAFLALVLALGAALTLRWVPRVPPLPPSPQPEPPAGTHWFSLKTLWATFARPLMRPVFGWVVLAEFLFMLGVLPLQRYLLYFLADRFGLARPGERAAIYLAAAVLLATVAALAGGFLSDRLGRWRVIRLSIAVAVVGQLGVSVAPTLDVVGIAGGVVALGVGAFLSVSWALFSDLIPVGSGAQFYGIANIASAGASALVGLYGPIIDLTRAFDADDAYRIAFGLAALVALTSLIPLRRAAGAYPTLRHDRDEPMRERQC